MNIAFIISCSITNICIILNLFKCFTYKTNLKINTIGLTSSIIMCFALFKAATVNLEFAVGALAGILTLIVLSLIVMIIINIIKIVR